MRISVACIMACGGCVHPVDDAPPRDAAPSIYRLIVMGDSYEGRRVTVSGYFAIEDGVASLYPTADHAKYRCVQEGFVVTVNPTVYRFDLRAVIPSEKALPEVVNRYVSISGIFASRPADSLDLWAGYIRDVNFVTLLPARADTNENRVGASEYDAVTNRMPPLSTLR